MRNWVRAAGASRPRGWGAEVPAEPPTPLEAENAALPWRLRRRHRTTVADPAAAKAPDLIGRDFTASEPNTKYFGDITYLPLDGGKFLYLATVIDLASRRLAGWVIVDHMRTGLVTDALAAGAHPWQPRRGGPAHRSRSPVHQPGVR